MGVTFVHFERSMQSERFKAKDGKMRIDDNANYGYNPNRNYYY
ncbi:hypothetical protein KNP414_01892 [Paenibacillus mucilaginosus KNP414]|uniref:Uncharacterized protein n=1 Tax=Paenibacillus mucilaginosus (strain KNP414) TaxID=1036673 RepID=F8FR16_PAEMK|nr:hypothetical protein KNP414_01892 [Paenibacillus mucilaginosus KNP414]